MQQAAEALENTAGLAMRVVACAMLLFGEITLSGCGNDQTATSSQASTRSATSITYNITPGDPGSPVFDGTYLGLSFSGLHAYVAMRGSMNVIPEVPSTADIALYYRIVATQLSPVDAGATIAPNITTSGELGFIQVNHAGVLVIELQLPIDGTEYQLSAQGSDPHYYKLEDGTLSLQGVALSAPFSPFNESPSLYLWAAPAS